jgi:hypothetical protein
MYLRLNYTKGSDALMLFSSLALHMLLLLLMGCRKRRRERRESGASMGAGCCPWWHGTVCTLGMYSTNKNKDS